MRHRLRWAVFSRLVTGIVAAILTVSACTSAVRSPAGPALPQHWVMFRHLAGVLDLAGPRGDGSFVVAAAGQLFVMNRAGALRPFARGPGGYSTALGPEPYITMTQGGRAGGSRCSFPGGAVFALEPGGHPAVIGIGVNGQARRFATLPGTAAPSGITFDSTGQFGHQLLVTATSRAGTTVLAIDCGGRVRTVAAHAPAMEGGIAVAPASFGRYGGDLIAPDERSGRIFAVTANGTVATLAVSDLPHGGDIGVESAGFLPPGFGAGGAAYLADRYSRGNPHPGTNSILRLSGAELIKAAARPGDLLVATEGSARTIVVRCASSCTLRNIAAGPAVAHGEGHIVFTGAGR